MLLFPRGLEKSVSGVALVLAVDGSGENYNLAQELYCARAAKVSLSMSNHVPPRLLVRNG